MRKRRLDEGHNIPPRNKVFLPWRRLRKVPKPLPRISCYTAAHIKTRMQAIPTAPLSPGDKDKRLRGQNAFWKATRWNIRPARPRPWSAKRQSIRKEKREYNSWRDWSANRSHAWYRERKSIRQVREYWQAHRQRRPPLLIGKSETDVYVSSFFSFFSFLDLLLFSCFLCIVIFRLPALSSAFSVKNKQRTFLYYSRFWGNRQGTKSFFSPFLVTTRLLCYAE